MSPSLIPPDPRVTIGSFARATQLSARTLRRYDALGILRPESVDPDTGYRYYSRTQFPRAETIRLLRSLDVPLREIVDILDHDDPQEAKVMLEQHLERVRERIARERHTVMRLESAVARGGALRAYQCDLREIPAQPVVAVRITTARDAINEAIDETVRRLCDHVAEHGLRVTGRTTVVYDFDPFEQDEYVADVCLPVSAAAASGGGVVALTLPACTAAVTVHHGPDDDLQSAFASLLSWIFEHDLEIVGHEREIYLVDESDSDDPRDHVTEIMWPVRPARATSPLRPA
jgi:DNA-binding transcriptional MerR regulator